MITVFVNGCFDVIHRGHIELFSYARSLGDKLIVGIDSDSRVKTLKGQERPFNNEEDRKFLLTSLKQIDSVFIFKTEEGLKELIKSINPQFMVVGSEYKNKKVIGSEHCGQLMFFNRIANYSTTSILNKK
jgi:D-beta-D-heptose 7-phosphate kinase/D-beta-D-heptose 1-phosphate adenosyltransferase